LLPHRQQPHSLGASAGADPQGSEECRDPIGIEGGAERLERPQGAAGVVDGDVGLAAGEHTTELEPGSSQFEWELQAGPRLECRLQVGGGSLGVAAGHRHSALGARRHRPQPVAIHRRRNVGQPPSSGNAPFEIAGGQVGVDEQVEGGGEMRAVLREMLEPLFEVAASGRRVASGQHQRRERQRLLGFGLDSLVEMGQQLLGLLEATLTDPQAGQAGQCLGMQPRAGAVGDAETGIQLAFGVVPPSLGGQHGPVVDAALGVQERAAIGSDEVVGHLAPLRGPLDVARQLAGAEHVAAGVDHRVQGRALTGQRGGHGLVDQREASGGLALADPHQPELGHGDELEVDITGRPRHIDGPHREVFGGIEVSHPVGAGHPHPAVQGSGLERLQQPLGPPEPAVGRREVGEVRLVGDSQPDRALRRAPHVSRLAEQRVGAATPVNAVVVLAQPPQRRRQPEVRLRRLAVREHLLERGARLSPPPLSEGVGVGERLLAGHLNHCVARCQGGPRQLGQRPPPTRRSG